jgi:hypothetical protein
MARKENASQVVAMWHGNLGMSRVIRKTSHLGDVCNCVTGKVFWVSGEDQPEDLTHSGKVRGCASMNLAVFYLGISRSPATPDLVPQIGRATDSLQFGGISLAGALREGSTVKKVTVLETSKLSKPAGALVCDTNDEAREFDDMQFLPSHDSVRGPRLDEYRISRRFRNHLPIRLAK